MGVPASLCSVRGDGHPRAQPAQARPSHSTPGSSKRADGFLQDEDDKRNFPGETQSMILNWIFTNRLPWRMRLLSVFCFVFIFVFVL